VPERVLFSILVTHNKRMQQTAKSLRDLSAADAGVMRKKYVDW